MDSIVKTLRVALFTTITFLIVGVLNFPAYPLLWGFILLVLVNRTVEVFNPAGDFTSSSVVDAAQPRWLHFLAAIVIITNLVLPVLDFRYRGEVFWTSPLPQMPWWSWIGLLLMLAGIILKINVLRTQRLPEPSSPASGGKKKTSQGEPPLSQLIGMPREQRQALLQGILLFYGGIAVIFTSLWGLIGVFLVVLPVAYRRFLGVAEPLSEHTFSA